ncbi:hypothetical protein NAG74_11705 [Sinorhizobium meliloti]|nr:hypothetical protein [Sinorhizobium meliloti]MCO5962506.1 hypothetical protein [Sinorhizobium meliloti]
MFEHMTPGRREGCGFHATVKHKPVTESSLKILDTASDGRLRQIEPKGGTVHRTRFRNRHESLNVL